MQKWKWVSGKRVINTWVTYHKEEDSLAKAGVILYVPRH